MCNSLNFTEPVESYNDTCSKLYSQALKHVSCRNNFCNFFTSSEFLTDKNNMQIRKM